VDLNAANGKVLSIEVASDKPNNYNEFSKRIQEVASKNLGMVFVMPLFDFEELKCLFPEDDSKLLCLLNEIVGGSARNLNWILGECDEKSEFHVAKNDQISSKLIEVTDWYFENFEHETYLKFRNSILNAIKKKLSQNSFSMVNSFFLHRVNDIEQKWASKFIEILAYEINADLQKEV
jgi:hypothetical protein